MIGLVLSQWPALKIMPLQKYSAGGMPRMDTISQGDCDEGELKLQLPMHCVPLMNIYHCRLLPEMGVGDRARVGG